ncbi:hypothetical protein [Sphingomonas sp. 3-13AW]|uniref:hypothetical protein n=1 Tax=Sphingomonas sp. 3-13AW TaxID=3050450 RepID=UPI003BB69A71
MSIGIAMLAAAAASHIPACPPVSDLSKTAPVALRIRRSIPPLLTLWKVKLGEKEVLASTSYFIVDDVPTAFHVLRSAGVPGTTRLYAACNAPWGEVMCARDTFHSSGEAPVVFVRRHRDRTVLVVRYEENRGRRYEVLRLDQLTGLKKVCG